MPALKVSVPRKPTPSKVKIGRAPWPVRVSGRKPEWFHTREDALERAAELTATAWAGGVTTDAERNTLRAAIDLYVARVDERVDANKISFSHGEHSKTHALSWVTEKRKVVKAELAHLPADHWRLRERSYIDRVDTVARLVDGIEIGKLDCAGISAADVTKWLKIYDGRTTKTIREKLISLKQAFDIAVEKRWCVGNPASNIRLEETKYGASEAEVEAGTIERFSVEKIRALIEAAGDAEKVVGNTPWCDALALSFLAQTGLRFGELAALKWKFIDFDKKRVYVRSAVRKAEGGTATVGITKTVRSGEISKSRRSVFLTPHLIAELKEWKLRSPASGDEDRVFLTHSLEMHKDSNHLRRNVLHPACDKAGIDRLRVHDLRHFFASLCVDRYGDNWNRIADLLGHESTETTRKHYAEWIDNADRDDDDGEAFDDALWGAA